MIHFLARAMLWVMAGLFAVNVSAPATARELVVARPIMPCGALAESDLASPGEAPARIITAKLVAAAPGGPSAPYCEVRGYVASQIRFEIRLPTENWRQRLLYNGCGGFCGRVDFRVRAAEGCAPVENGEFAMVASDLGHDTPDGNRDTVWAAGSRQAKIDYGYRAVHVVTVAAKAIIARFYGRPQAYAYFNGCSDGGREAMMEVQRFPIDFNGVIAGASVIHDTVNNSLFHVWVARHLERPDGSQVFSTSDLAVLHQAALAACDTVGDGMRDGVIGDPRACRFDPAQIVCANQRTHDCLTPEQVAAAKAVYSGPVDPSGRALYYGRPVGSELGWSGGNIKALAEGFIRYMAADTPQPFDYQTITFDRGSLTKYSMLASVYDAVDTDISAFQRAGGKLIMWHGWGDPGVPPMSSVDYYSAVRRKLGSSSDDLIRLYMLPGVGHCSGGEGPDRINLVDAITGWVEDGKAPGAINATRTIYGRIVQAASVLPYSPVPQ